MPRDPGVLAVFADPSAAARAVRAAHAAGQHDVRAAMPAPFPEVMEAMAQKRSLIGAVTLCGAVLGMCLGLWLTIGTSLALPISVGGKPIVSLPAFLVIVFEVTVLVGGLSNFLGMLIGAYLGRRKSFMPEDPRFLRDRIGVFLPGAGESARELLRAAGAEEVHDVA
jgi:Protein of unknown function (DUF3341)